MKSSLKNVERNPKLLDEELLNFIEKKMRLFED